MTPQEATVLRHLEIEGHITPVEAATVYKIRHLPSKVFYLKRRGYDIKTVMKADLMGQRYARYTYSN